MRPLLEKTTINEAILADTKSKNPAKAVCIGGILTFIILISILSYFNFGASNFTTNNPAKSLYHKQTSSLDDSVGSDFYKASGQDDIILTLPNLDLTTCSSSITECEFNQYSGYLLANNNREIHYWFIEADTTDDPTTKPLFIWTNGGPGCSGMDGLLTEHGPWRVMDNLDIHYNPYSWNKEVNIVYLEQPYGVGFSEATDGDVVAGDQNAADDMDAVIRNFLTKFPQYLENRVYISAESWGGHYVPMTTETILQNNAAGSTPRINIGGFLLGNPYTDFYENVYGFVGDIYGHGLMLSKDWDQWREDCWDNTAAIDNHQDCAAIYTRAYISSYNANVYALDYPQCPRDEQWKTDNVISSKYHKHSHIHHHAEIFMKRVLDYEDYDALKMRIVKEELTGIYNKLIDKDIGSIKAMDSSESSEYTSVPYLPCIEYNMADWLNLDEVQTALHVKPIEEWNMCSDAVWMAWPESDYDTYMQTYYDNIITEYSSEQNLKLCVYSGDDDSVCGLQGTQYWLDRWDGYEPNEHVEWVPWEDDDSQLGGYYTQYLRNGDDDHNNVALHFVTVRSAGHMVPTTEPSRALTLLRQFLYEME